MSKNEDKKTHKKEKPYTEMSAFERAVRGTFFGFQSNQETALKLNEEFLKKFQAQESARRSK